MTRYITYYGAGSFRIHCILGHRKVAVGCDLLSCRLRFEQREGCVATLYFPDSESTLSAWLYASRMLESGARHIDLCIFQREPGGALGAGRG